MQVFTLGLILRLREREPRRDTALDLHFFLHLHICHLSLTSCVSPQLSQDDYREHAYTFMPGEMDIDVSSVWRDATHGTMLRSAAHDQSQLFAVFSFRANWACCVSRIKWWGHTRKNCSSCTERRWLNTAHLSSSQPHTVYRGVVWCGANRTKNKLNRIHSLQLLSSKNSLSSFHVRKREHLNCLHPQFFLIYRVVLYLLDFHSYMFYFVE